MKPKYLVVETESLPDVFCKVVKAKQLLSSGQVKTTTQATKKVGLSRTAFYKYKDKVHAYSENREMQLLTLNFLVKDEPGVLSDMLTTITGYGANVLTINQNIPSDSVAPVTLCIRCDRMTIDSAQLLEVLHEKEYVVEAMIVKAE